jgi:chorismate mutase
VKLNQERLAILLCLAISGMVIARAQNAAEKLEPLVEVSAHRLALAKQVALAKWDRQAPVEDPPREAQVVAAAVTEGESKGLDRKFVSNFFRAQIEANKIIQYSLLADWYRQGRAPAHRQNRFRQDRATGTGSIASGSDLSISGHQDHPRG